MSNFSGQVAIVTGAASGLGRSHAIALGAKGATVIVNDIAAAGRSAQEVVDEITAVGGRARFEAADVSELDEIKSMTARTIETFGRVDVLICNAGILRDRSFAKMEMEDFSHVLRVHLEGSANCCHAVWAQMREQGYGRILLTTSSSGLYGNFGQTNYGAAKAGMIGLMNCLHIEGQKYGIHVNCLCPAAATAMTAGLLSPDEEDLLDPRWVSPAALYLTNQSAPSKMVLGAGAGVYSSVRIVETQGAWLPEAERTPEGIAANIEVILDREAEQCLETAFDQTKKFVRLGRAGAG